MSETQTRVAILASGDIQTGGGGSTANHFARDVLSYEDLAIEVGVVICNNPPGTVGVYDHFDSINSDFVLKGDDRIDVVNIGPNTHPGNPVGRGQTADESSAVCRVLEERGIDFVVMLGNLRILTSELIGTWGWKPEYARDKDFSYREGMYHPYARISNNHPSILPFTVDTHGPSAHKRALTLHERGILGHTAMTWHLASAQVDKGPIIDEIPVKIDWGDDADSLAAKVQAVEKDETAEVISKHLKLRAEHLSAARRT